MHDGAPASPRKNRSHSKRDGSVTTAAASLSGPVLAPAFAALMADQVKAVSGLDSVWKAIAGAAPRPNLKITLPVFEQARATAEVSKALASIAQASQALSRSLAAPMIKEAKAAASLNNVLTAATQPHRDLGRTLAQAVLPVVSTPPIHFPKPIVPALPSFPVPVVPVAALCSSVPLASQVWRPLQEQTLAHLRNLLAPASTMFEKMHADWLRSLRRWGRRCYRAVCAALEAVRRGDLEPIRRFIRWELRVSVTEDRVQALATALLAPGWEDGLDLDDDAVVRKYLRRRANENNKFVGEHKILGQHIAYVQEGLDLWPASSPGPERQVLNVMERWDDPRLPLVLEHITHEEQAVAHFWAENYPVTWEQAAIACGREPQFGERVRRKLRRRGKEITARQASRR